MNKLVLVAIGTSCLACGQQLQMGKTERIEFPAGGSLRIEHLRGDLTVEGWDQPAVEFTMTPSDTLGGGKPDPFSLTAEHSGDQVIITRRSQRGSSPGVGGLRYHIKVPRNARLLVAQKSGEVHVAELTGDLRVTVRSGEITLRLPPEAQYDIDAKSSFGAIVSDFPGRERRTFWLVGHRFVPAGTQTPHKLYLRTGYGDIIVQKIRKPPAP